jgi:hypothetical protein
MVDGQGRAPTVLEPDQEQQHGRAVHRTLRFTERERERERYRER